MTTTTGQMPVYLMSLRRDRGRRQPLTDQLNCAGISYELFEAIDGTKISEAHIKQYNRERARYFSQHHHPLVNSLLRLWTILMGKNYMLRAMDRELLPGEIGCALSHFKIYEKIVHNGTPWSVILEDDAQLLFDIKDLLNHINRLNPKWDLILLGYNYQGFISRVDRRGVPLSLIGRKYLSDGFPLGKLTEIPHFGSHAYIISRAGAAQLLQAAKPLRYQADLLLATAHKFSVKVAAFSPRVIGLHSLGHADSTIAGRKWYLPEQAWRTQFRQRYSYLYAIGKRIYLLMTSYLLLLRQCF